MSLLLRKVKADPLRSVELIPAVLEIYDDKIVFKDKGLLSRKESTISYKQVSQVSINKGLVHSTIEIINTGGFKNIKFEHIRNETALEAKEIIEQFVHQVHTPDTQIKSTDNSESDRMRRLRELLEEGLITAREFEQKRKKILAEL